MTFRLTNPVSEVARAAAEEPGPSSPPRPAPEPVVTLPAVPGPAEQPQAVLSSRIEEPGAVLAADVVPAMAGASAGDAPEAAYARGATGDAGVKASDRHSSRSVSRNCVSLTAADFVQLQAAARIPNGWRWLGDRSGLEH